MGPLGNLGSISPMFHKQLLHAQILKAKKKTVRLSVFLALSGSACAKADCRTLVKLTPASILKQNKLAVVVLKVPSLANRLILSPEINHMKFLDVFLGA